MCSSDLATVLPQARAGKVKIIAVIQPTRFDGMPDVPTLRELLPGFDVPVAWYAFFGPPSLPGAIVSRWNSEIVKTIESPDVRQKLTESSMALMYTPPEQMAGLIKGTAEVYERLFKSTGITLED